MRSMLKEPLQQYRSTRRQQSVPFRSHSDLQGEISVISVAFMGRDQLPNCPSDWNNRKIESHLERLPMVFANREKHKIASFSPSVMSFSQPSSPVSSPKLALKQQYRASPSSSAGDSLSPPHFLSPVQQLFPIDEELSMRAKTRRIGNIARNCRYSFSEIHFSQSISPFRSSKNSSLEPVSAAVMLSKNHLRSNFPRHVFGGLAGRRKLRTLVSMC